MTIKDVVEILDAKVLAGESYMENEVHTACGCDMMSDVLAFVKDQSVLLTGLVNLQVVRTADMMDIVCIVFVRGKMPDRAILDLAQEKGIAVLSTTHPMFTSCGLLYSKGLSGGVNSGRCC